MRTSCPICPMQNVWLSLMLKMDFGIFVLIKSSLVTPFRSPFGRFSRLCMPFGINTALEEFKRRQQRVLEGLPRVKSVHDDILIHVIGEEKIEEQKNHYRNFKWLMKRCRQKQPKLNIDKMKFRRSQMNFIGHTITSNKLKADAKKLSSPGYTGFCRFVGFVTYLAKFLPTLCVVSEPLRKHTQKDIEWHWTSEPRKATRQVKYLVLTDPVFQPWKRTNSAMWCDLAALLREERRPIFQQSLNGHWNSVCAN